MVNQFIIIFQKSEMEQGALQCIVLYSIALHCIVYITINLVPILVYEYHEDFRDNVI